MPMVYKDFCIQPENELDERFINEEMTFLIDVSIKQQHLIKSKTEYASVIKQHYKLWLENHGRSKTNYSH